MRTRLLAALALLACPLGADEPAAAGRVIDAITLEAVAGATVTIVGRQTAVVTDASGQFRLSGPRPVELVVTAAGYAPRRASVTADADEIEVRLEPEALRRAEEVAVLAGAYVSPDASAPSSRVLGSAELASLASVLADDPLRSVQSLPGVAAGDDFGATFALRGLGFDNVGFYVDGVLMSAPFHTVRDVNDGFSLTLLNSSVVESLALISEGAPAAYGGRTGSVLSATLREGSRERFQGRASVGLTGLQTTLEGPIGSEKKTTWLVSARKSYVDYVLERIDRVTNVLGFYDTTARLTHHPTSSQTVSLGWLHGRSRWRNTADDLRPQDSMTADAGTDLATLQWRRHPSSRSDLRGTAFLAGETGRNRNLDGMDRTRSARRQWGLRADAMRALGSHRLEAGVTFRRLSEDVLVREFVRKPSAKYRIVSSQDTRDHESGVYVQDTWTTRDERRALVLGGRLDRYAATGETRALPRAALRWDVSENLRLLAAHGRYAQFPDFQQLFGRGGNPGLRAERATHSLVGLERRFDGDTSVRVEAYDLGVAGLFFNPEGEWRLRGDVISGPEPDAPLHNALSGRSRGLEVLVRRQTAGGLSGWIAYTFGRSRWHDDAGLTFDGDFDQRHTLTLFAACRLGPTLNVSTKYRYGSGFPVPGFYEPGADGVFLSSERNAYRPGGYSRWDVRADKAFVFGRWKLTLYGEVVNVLDHTQQRYTGLDGLDVQTGRVFFESDTLFPLLPSLGVTVDF